MSKVCGVCEWSVKAAGGWLCNNMNSMFRNYILSYESSCKDFAPRNRCKVCYYKDVPVDKEPCLSCTRVNDGYKPIE